jgi:NADP-dependent 3-hydroxy acid dehydrogenase YdfG
MDQRVAVVTGASSGIGAATARRLAAEGFAVVGGARRLDRLREVLDPIGGWSLPLDVTDPGSVATFAEAVGPCQVLVNNAGGALGADPIATADDADWSWMYEANVAGTQRVTRALLPALEASGDGHVVMMGSVAGLDPYPNGGGYCGVKAALNVFTKVLRMELLGRPLRITEIDPGLVETEFSVVRYRGDEERAAAVYQGVVPLTADDVADAVAYAVTRPSRVNVDQIVLTSRNQAGGRLIHRRDA